MGYKFAKITSKIKIIDESNKNQSQNKQGILYELNAPEDLSLPSRSREVLVKLFKMLILIN